MRLVVGVLMLLIIAGCKKATEPEIDNGFSVDGILVSIRKQASAQDNDTTLNIYTMNPQSGSLNRLPISTQQYDETNPIFRHGKLYFASNRDGDLDIYRADPETGEITQVFHMAGDQSGPSPSPGGRYIAYHFREASGSTWDVGIYDTQSSSVIKTLGTSGKMDMDPYFVNDSILVLILQDFQGNTSQDIWMYNLNTDQLTILENTPANQNARPRVSPDGSRIAYIQSDLYLSYSYLIVADFPDMGNKDTLMADPGIFVKYIAWSPDGSKIAFSASTGSYQAPANRVYIADVNSGIVNLLYEGGSGEDIRVNDWH